MTWFPVDDSFHSHPKQMAASLAAIGLWSVAGSWSSKHLTDGFVPDHVIPSLSRGQVELAKELVGAGLWRRSRGGYQFHQWIADGDGSARNPTRAEAMSRRTKMASGGSLGNHRRWHVEKGVTKPDCQFCQPEPDRLPDRVPDHPPESGSESGANPPSPSPSPSPSPYNNGSLSDHSAGDQSVRARARENEAIRWLHTTYGLTDDQAIAAWTTAQARAREPVRNPVRYLLRMVEHGHLADIVKAITDAAEQPRQPSVRDSQPLVVVPDWCGRCHERTRMIEVGDDARPKFCPDCHPNTRREAS